MKTLTEFSTLVLRNAAAARAAARAAGVEAPAAVVAAPAVDGEVAAPSEEAPSEEAPSGDAPAEGESTAPVNPLIAAVAATLGVPEDRAQRLLEALDIIGD